MWTFLSFPIWIVLASSYALFKPMTLLSVSRRVDIELNLKERLSTALVFNDKITYTKKRFGLDPEEKLISTQDPNHQVRPDMIARQYYDAYAHASAVQAKHDLPLIWSRRFLAWGLLLLVLLATLIALPNPMDLILTGREAIQEEAQEQAEEIEHLKDTLEESTELSPATQQELLRQLDELAKALRQNPGDIEQALADLSKFEDNLRQRVDPNLATKQALLDSLSSRLEDLTQQDPEASKNQPNQDSLNLLADQIEAMDDRQRELLARNLAQMSAQSTQAGDARLGQALANLAQAVLEYDQQAITNSTEELQASLDQLEDQLTDQQTVQNALAQAQSSRQSLSQTGRAYAQSQGQSGAQNQGAASNQSQGSQAGPGGGSRANQLPPATGGRTNVRPQGSAPVTAPGELETQIFSPWQRPETNGEELFIPGQEAGEGETTTREGQNPQAGIANPALVPYNQVFLQYLNSANQAIQQGYVPGNLKDYVRNYFSSLEPGN
jgi:hypothetical protein